MKIKVVFLAVYMRPDPEFVEIIPQSPYRKKPVMKIAKWIARQGMPWVVIIGDTTIKTGAILWI